MENTTDFLEESADGKCAEIFYQNFEVFSIVCTQCGIKTLKFDEFKTHFKKVHSALSIDNEEEISLDDNKYLIQMTTDSTEINYNEDIFKSTEAVKSEGESCSTYDGEQDLTDLDDDLPLLKLQQKNSAKMRIIRDSESEYNCTDCKRSYKSKKGLQRHNRDKHRNNDLKVFQCNCCDKTYCTKDSLNAHCRIKHCGSDEDTKPKTYSCTSCDKVYTDKYTLKHHLIRHTGVKNYICDVAGCRMDFFTKRGLNSHRRIVHIATKNFVCEMCGHRTKSSGALEMHKRTHTGEKPFKCLICDKAFATQSAVVEHKVIHSSTRPHVCDICGKSFARPKALYHHKPLHFDIKKFVCKICGKAYAQRAGLSAHKRQHLLKGFGEAT